MKKTLLQATLFAYINTLCFRNFNPTCTKISEQYNRNIIQDFQCSVISHDRLQRLLQLEQNWNLYLKKVFGHLVNKDRFKNNKKNKKTKTFLIIDDTVLAKPFSKELDILSWVYSK